MSPPTCSRKSRPVCCGSRSYRCAMIETSSPGSMMSAAASDSSSDRRAGCLLFDWDRTTVNRDRLMGGIVADYLNSDKELNVLINPYPGLASFYLLPLPRLCGGEGWGEGDLLADSIALRSGSAGE